MQIGLEFICLRTNVFCEEKKKLSCLAHVLFYLGLLMWGWFDITDNLCQNSRHQYAEIEKVVEEIINRLGYRFSSLPKDLVGMDSPIPIEELEKFLLFTFGINW